jgi:hypothetical protein
VPEITAVSKPKSRPPSAATMALRSTSAFIVELPRVGYRCGTRA